VTALALMAVLLVTGLLSPDDALSVFANPAPLTVGAMFIISTALERCGAMDIIAHNLDRMTKLSYPLFMLAMMTCVAVVSAFINNTPVVVVFMPVVMAMAKTMNVPASKLLIPLSFAAVLGGLCTLIGTSTNIVVSGIATQYGAPAIGMFELAAVGVPVALAGIAYLTIFGQKLLPARETLTSILTDEERREFITEAFVQSDSPHIGKSVKEAGLIGRRGVRVIEVIRSGVVLRDSLAELKLEEGDRMVLACRPSGIAHTKQLQGIDFVAEQGLGLEQIAAHEGLLVEGVIGPNSELIGHTILEANFRQRYRVIILAVHRRGKNVREKLATLRLEFGDTLLLLGTEGAVTNLRNSTDIMLIDRPPVTTENRRRLMPAVLVAIAAIIVCSTFDFARIEIAAFIACVGLFVIGAVRPKEGYASVQWNILFLIFAMLGMGLAMEKTGAALWLSNNTLAIVEHLVSPEMQPLVMLGCIYFVTMVLTEILSNNAAAAVMATIAIQLAAAMQVDSRPFIVAVAIAASAAFATPIGYQTNTYVYGVGGYRFSDFIKVGVPLNIIAMITALFVIPRVWSF
ncbi:MAG: SLC13 family permease, partial [Opitutaceae bacterium]